MLGAFTVLHYTFFHFFFLCQLKDAEIQLVWFPVTIEQKSTEKPV